MLLLYTAFFYTSLGPIEDHNFPVHGGKLTLEDCSPGIVQDIQDPEDISKDNGGGL